MATQIANKDVAKRLRVEHDSLAPVNVPTDKLWHGQGLYKICHDRRLALRPLPGWEAG